MYILLLTSQTIAGKKIAIVVQSKGVAQSKVQDGKEVSLERQLRLHFKMAPLYSILTS